MIKNLLIAGVLIGLTIFFTIWFEASFKSQKAQFFLLEEGKTVPDVSFQVIDGKKYTLSDFDKRPVVIHFWATWCPPCVVELPEIINMAENNPDVIVIAISTDRMQPVIERFIKMNMPDVPENFLIIHDKGKDITEGQFNVFKLPESFVLDKNHVLKKHIRGVYEGWAEFQP